MLVGDAMLLDLVHVIGCQIVVAVGLQIRALEPGPANRAQLLVDGGPCQLCHLIVGEINVVVENGTHKIKI